MADTTSRADSVVAAACSAFVLASATAASAARCAFRFSASASARADGGGGDLVSVRGNLLQRRRFGGGGVRLRRGVRGFCGGHVLLRLRICRLAGSYGGGRRGGLLLELRGFRLRRLVRQLGLAVLRLSAGELLLGVDGALARGGGSSRSRKPPRRARRRRERSAAVLAAIAASPRGGCGRLEGRRASLELGGGVRSLDRSGVLGGVIRAGGGARPCASARVTPREAAGARLSPATLEPTFARGAKAGGVRGEREKRNGRDGERAGHLSNGGPSGDGFFCGKRQDSGGGGG